MASHRDALRRGADDEAQRVEIHLPEEVPWMVHRIATSRRYCDPLHTIMTRWSLVDVFEANLVLDALEDAEERARAAAEDS